MSNPTNQQVFDYYADKNVNQRTQEFAELDGLDENENEYVQVYNDFKKNNYHRIANEENKSLNEILTHWKNRLPVTHPIYIYEKGDSKSKREKYRKETQVIDLNEIDRKLNMIIKVDDIHILHPEKDGSVEIVQKWHLFVCVLIYGAVCGYYPNKSVSPWMWDKPNNYWGRSVININSYLLRLWMLENSDDICNGLYKNQIEKVFTRTNNLEPGTRIAEIKNAINANFLLLTENWPEPH